MKTLMTLVLALAATTACTHKDKEGSTPAPVQKVTDDKAPPTATPDKPGDKQAADGKALPTECNDYKAAIDRVATCDKLDAATRDSLKKSYDTASATWATLQADAKANLATSCKAALDAVNASAKTTCGW